ncbi:GH92 family glycosyl hydrolase [Streptomyces violaceorubidus]
MDTAPDGGKRAAGVDGGFGTGIPGNVTDHVTDVRASAENTGGREVKENFVDDEPGTKWLTFAPTGWVEFDLDKPAKIARYALTSANDLEERDPKDWTLKGSADGEDWKTLDTRSTNPSPSGYRRRRTHSPPPSSGTSGWRSPATTAPTAPYNSPTCSSPPAAPRPRAPGHALLRQPRPDRIADREGDARFTGKNALRYAGRHTTDGRAYSYNKVFDVNVAVARHSLSYQIFPSMADGDLDYDATNVSVDLAFTDGTYLSGLKATDQHGFALTPHGQGAAKVLYVNQWNNVDSRIGSVAAGNTVDRILAAYDSPKGPAKFRGWLDDVTIERAAPENPKAHLSDYALTTRGTNSSGGFSRGNNFPATAVPHGFNFGRR